MSTKLAEGASSTSKPVANKEIKPDCVRYVPKWPGTGCAHLQQWVTQPEWKDSYRTVLKLVNALRLQRLYGKAVLKAPTCFTCGSGHSGGKLYISLHGVFIGCRQHMVLHAKSNQGNLGIDINHGEVFCFACNDIIYDSKIEEARAFFLKDVQDGQAKAARKVLPRSSESPTKKLKMDDGATDGADVEEQSPSVQLEGISRADLRCLPQRKGWVPRMEQVAKIQQHAELGTGHEVVAGLRGFHNVGNTCFLNCVLQGLLHNPGVRDYFLGDYHNRHRCQKRREAEGRGDAVCMGCEMDRLVNDCYKGSKTAYIPHHFLYSMWKSSHHLAGYEQQDAHECFISVLDALHSCCADDVAGAPGIIAKLFSGRLRSEVTCLSCNAASTTVDPFLDISLDLLNSSLPVSSDGKAAEPAAGKAEAGAGRGVGSLVKGMWGNAEDGGLKKDQGTNGVAKKEGGEGGASGSGSETSGDTGEGGGGGGGGGGGKAGAGVKAGGAVGLEDCLRWFTRVERLDAQSYKCEACKAYREGLKQLSLDGVAPSICFQIKRFESVRSSSGGGAQQSFKVDTHVHFPATLDVAPYMSAAARRQGAANGGPDAEKGGGDDPLLFSLYAVVVHIGKLDSGHYVAYIRRGSSWFFCDDASVVLVPVEEVLAAQAYLLLYIASD